MAAGCGWTQARLGIGSLYLADLEAVRPRVIGCNV
jgi:hypothetical protein